MADFYGRTIFTETLTGFSVSSFALSRIGMAIISSQLRAGELKIPRGQMVICVRAGGDENNLEQLLQMPQNPSLDALIWIAFAPADRPRVFDVIRNVVAPSAEVARENVFKKAGELAVIVSTYLVHGTIGNLVKARPAPLSYACKAVGINQAAFNIRDCTRLQNIDNLRFVGLIKYAREIIAAMHPTFQSRVRLSVGGNRILAILKDILARLVFGVNVPEVLCFLAQRDVLDLSPFISFHPDHPANPLANTSRALYAAVGSWFRESGGDWEPVFAANPGLYIQPIRERLQVEFRPAVHILPSMVKIVDACDPEYSLA